MELINEFSVAVPVDEAWKILTDLERIAPCLPGAQLQEVEGDEYRGVVKVKVGPITAQYKGKASFSERDDSGHRAVIRAEGRDTRGNGNASATITATLAPEASGTKVLVVTDLAVTGKVAQFGRGVLADVSSKLMDQFVQSLEADVLNGAANEAAAATPEPEASADPEVHSAPSEPRKIDSRPAEPVNLLGTAGPSMLKRVAPAIAVLVLLLLLRQRRKNR
ncbi:MAG TPA: SRPBCC family protein [Acidimicrobiales bacterium]|nr:SRPBCC family protein [Acidimicrobiales bacterium]